VLTHLSFFDYFYLLVVRFSSNIPRYYYLRFKQYPIPLFFKINHVENHSPVAQSNAPSIGILFAHYRGISHIPTAPGVKSLKIYREEAEPVSLATCSSTRLLSGSRFRSRKNIKRT
jgi:hypothetical protein